MTNSIKQTTQNPIVDTVGKMNLTGNVIPESWYHTIKNKNGKVNPLAILILSDIVYWYRPTEIRDEATLSVSYSKKFHDDNYLQRSYEQLMDKFNIFKLLLLMTTSRLYFRVLDYRLRTSKPSLRHLEIICRNAKRQSTCLTNRVIRLRTLPVGLLRR